MLGTHAQISLGSADPVHCGLKDARTQTFTKTFLSLFGATSFLPLKIQIAAGVERLHDAQIERAVLRRMDLGQEQTCLEIGAGRSYPQRSQCQGSPYLARALAEIVRDSSVTLVSSDLIGLNEKVVFFLDRAGVLSTHGQTVVDSSLPISQIATHNGSVTIEPLSSEAMSYPPLRTLVESAEAGSRHHIERVFVRPAFDPELERAAFGLLCVPQVDFRVLGQFADSSVDVVFARYLNPYISQSGSLPLVMQACERVLRSGGDAILHVDGEALLIGEKRDAHTLWRRQVS